MAAGLVGISLVLSGPQPKALVIGFVAAPILGWVGYRAKGLISSAQAKRKLTSKRKFVLESVVLYLAVAFVFFVVPEEWFGALGLALAGGGVGVALKLLIQGRMIESEFLARDHEPQDSGP